MWQRRGGTAQLIIDRDETGPSRAGGRGPRMDDETRQRGSGVKEDEARERLRQMCLHPSCHLVAWLYCDRSGVTTGAGENTFPLRHKHKQHQQKHNMLQQGSGASHKPRGQTAAGCCFVPGEATLFKGPSFMNTIKSR